MEQHSDSTPPHAHGKRYAVGIVGATGMVGAKLAEVLDRRNFPVDYSRCKLFASERSARKVRHWGEQAHILKHATSAEDFAGLDIVFLSAGGDKRKSEVSELLCPLVAQAGAVAIDNSSFWRMDPDVPLVVSEVNPDAAIQRPKGIIANPNCTTMIAAPVLAALHRVAGLEAVNATTSQSVSGQGLAGVQEALRQIEEMIPEARKIVDGTADHNCWSAPEAFPKRVGFNAAPLAGELSGPHGNSSEEAKFVNETRKILGLDELPVSATCVRVPVLNGHSIALSVGLSERLSPSDAQLVLQECDGIQVADVPMPLDASGKDEVLVGRIREDVTRSNGLELFISGDNLLKGAALNAVQVAELVIAEASTSAS